MVPLRGDHNIRHEGRGEIPGPARFHSNQTPSSVSSSLRNSSEMHQIDASPTSV